MTDHKKQGEEADAMIAALQQVTNRPDEHAGDDDAPIPSETTDADTSTSEDPGVAVVEATKEEPKEEPEPPAADDVSAQIAGIQSELKAANQRWKVAQGMIEKKDSELEHLRMLMAALVDKQASPEPAQAPKASKLVTSQDIEDFGEPMYEFVTKVAKDVMSEALTAYDATVNQRVSNLSESVDTVKTATAKTAADRFEEQLQTLVPDWKELNVDEGFSAWLDTVDDLAGSRRLDMLLQAYEALDARRTAAFFQQYKATLAPAAAPVAEAPSAPARDPKKHIAPGKSKASAQTSEAPEGRIWDGPSIAKVYDDRRAGRISKKDFDVLERDIFKAQRDGRFVA